MPRRQAQLSVTLFPFLAVLVCAMGSLILLLLVMTRKIREDQRAEQVSPPEVTTPADVSEPVFVDRTAELQQLVQAAAALEASAQGLRQTVTRLQQELTAQRTLVASRRAELNALRTALADKKSAPHDDAEAVKEIQTLKAREEQLTAELSAAEAALLDKRNLLARAEDELRETELQLFEKSSALVALRQRATQAETAAEKATGTETLLEFTNPTGTSRIPIVIDVTRNGYELLPSGLKISARDMEQFPVRDNPLLSSVFAVHRHRSGSSVVAEPYVLLLVRPGGSLPFYGAQRIFQEARVHYGYELVQPETMLLAGPVDPSESPAVQRALADVFRRRETLYSRLFEIAKEERERLESGQRMTRQGGDHSSGEAADASAAEAGDNEKAGRRLAVRPDGRVVEDVGPPRRRLEGRFYAGGVAPPSTFFENRASSAVAGNPRGRLNAAQAEQMAEEFAAAYARQRAMAEASAAAQREASAAQPQYDAARPSAAAEPAIDFMDTEVPGKTAENLRNPAEQRFAETLFGGDGSLQGSRLVGPRSDAFGGVPESHETGSAASVTAADVLASAAPSGNSGNRSEDVQRAPWYQSSQPDPAAAADSQGVPGNSATPASENSRSGLGQLGAGQPRIDRETLRLLNGPVPRNSSSLKVPVGIVVFLDERHLAVAQQPAVALPADNPLVAEAALLQGINHEIQDARRSPRDDLLPVVRFVVSPGGERWRLRLARSLKQAGIASVTQYELTPYMIPGDATGRADLEEAAEEAVP